MNNLKSFLDKLRQLLKRLVYHKRKIICPNCYNRFLGKDVEFICQNDCCDNYLKPFTASTKSSRFLIPVNEPCPGKAKHANGTQTLCWEKSTIRQCPHCHNRLPLDAGLIKSLIIAIIGGPGSSKSHYLVELFHRLKQIKQKVGIIPSINVGKASSDFNDVFKKVYPDEGGIPKIVAATTQPVRYHFDMNYKKKKLTLTFYDNPGEHWEPAKMSDRVEERTKYIANANGIILLVDVMQLPNCRDLAKGMGKSLPNKRAWSQAELVETMYQEARKVITSSFIYIPVAVCLTKIDEMAMDFSDDRDLYSEIEKGTLKLDPYDNAVQMKCSNKLKERLDRWEPGLSSFLESRFDKVAYFAVAPTGCRPDQNGYLKDFNPIRVEDPFIWILEQLRLLGEDTDDE